jgi:hypothetical protein
MKRYIALFAAVILMATLTACGNNTAADTTEYHGEGQVQGGIKSDEEIENLQNEEQQSQNQEAEYVDNTGNEPDAYGTGNFQDYWEGDDYFDIEAYALANGCSHVNWADANLDYCTKDVAVHCRSLTFGKWEIAATAGWTVQRFDGTASYTVLLDDVKTHPISVSKSNPSTLSLEQLQLLVTILECLNNNPDSMDPLNGSSLNYY